jgi:hypothetical protein
MGNLVTAMNSSSENPVDWTVRILKGTLAETLYTLEAIAEEKNWPLERNVDEAQSICNPVNQLIKMAKSSRRDAALEAWVAQVRARMPRRGSRRRAPTIPWWSWKTSCRSTTSKASGKASSWRRGAGQIC